VFLGVFFSGFGYPSAKPESALAWQIFTDDSPQAILQECMVSQKHHNRAWLAAL